MAYCTQAQVEIEAGGAQALARLTDQSKSGNLDTDVLARAIADADAWIDSFVAKQRAVPLDPVPDVVRRVSVQETVYLLRCQKQSPTDRDEAKHDENLDWLKGVAKGLITLGKDPQPAKSALVSPAVVVADDADTEFTSTNTEGFW